MSLRIPSHVSPTTGSMIGSRPGSATSRAMIVSRTIPTLFVFVNAIGLVSIPDSRSHSSRVSSPNPLSRW